MEFFRLPAIKQGGKMTVDTIISYLIDKQIYEVSCIRYELNPKNSVLEFKVGELKCEIIKNRLGSIHDIEILKNHVIDQEFYETIITSEIQVGLYNFWELRNKNVIFFDSKSDEKDVNRAMNYLFQGHRIIDIKLKNKNDSNIKLLFSNGMEINLLNKDNTEGLFAFYYNNLVYGFSNKNDSILEKYDIMNKISKDIFQGFIAG